jgi:hypothetical protein
MYEYSLKLMPEVGGLLERKGIPFLRRQFEFNSNKTNEPKRSYYPTTAFRNHNATTGNALIFSNV